MPTDITKPNSHIYWQYLIIIAIVCAGITAYLDLRDRGDCMDDKIAVNEMSLRIQLAEIESRLAGIETALTELKDDLRRDKRNSYENRKHLPSEN